MDTNKPLPSPIAGAPATAIPSQPTRTPDEQRRYDREQADLRLFYGRMSRGGRRRFNRD